jgi:catalase
VILAGVVGLFAYAGGWFTPHALTPSKMVDVFQPPDKSQSGFRRNHAKGVCVNGYFESNGNGTSISKALVFGPGRTPVIGRFALGGGMPYQADAPHTVRSMALDFQLADGEDWRTGINNIPVFVAATPQAFYDLLLASSPEKMNAFLAKYPASAKAFGLLHASPVSSGFENSTFNSLNAFVFTNADGKTESVRWSMVSQQPFKPISATQPAEKNYLFDELIASVHEHPLQWHLMITIGQPGDPTNDATLPWPADRKQIDVGTLTIDHVESEETSPARDINFDPLILPNGISPSDDPILSARSAAYSQSFARREGETKQPSAVSPQEVGK